jgi:hypothetical protein
MGDSKQKTQALKDLEVAQMKWAEAANQRLKNASKGEWSPWQTIKMNYYDQFQLAPKEVEVYGGVDQSAEGRRRNATFDQAMKYAEERANAREKVQNAIDSGAESPDSIAKGQKFLSQDPQLDPAWLKMYPTLNPPKPVAGKP